MLVRGERRSPAVWLLCCVALATCGPTLLAQDAAATRAPATQPSDPTDASDDATPDRARARALMATATLTFVLFLAFLVGSYAMIRYGRRAKRAYEAPKPTRYVDAWSNYRISDEQIDEYCGDGEVGDDSSEEDRD